MTKTLAALVLSAIASVATLGIASAETVVIHRHGGFHRHFHPHPHFHGHRTVIIRR